MIKKARVLICDDSSTIRRILKSVIESSTDMEVVGMAKNGAEALELMPKVKPCAIILDVEMPVMDGLEALRKLREIDRLLPILMFSASTTRGAQLTFKALAMGANDYVAKPAQMQNLDEAHTYLGQRMLPLIRVFVQQYRSLRRRPGGLRPGAGRGGARALHRGVPPTPKRRRSGRGVQGPSPKERGRERPQVGHAPVAGAGAATLERSPHQRARIPGPRPAAPCAPARRARTIRLIVLGISTGGPGALGVLLPSLPKNLPVPILIVQHMPPVFTSLLAQRLDGDCSLRVREGVDGAVVKPGEVWIAPGDFHMAVAQRNGQMYLKLNQDAKEHSCRPAVDVLFRSAAESLGAAALGVVMTGMGSDGALGSVALRTRGARVLIQDKSSSVVWGMPGAVARLQGHDEVVPLDGLGMAIRREVAKGRAAGGEAARGKLRSA